MSFDFQGLRCFSSPEDTSLHYFLPRQPTLQRDDNGHPIFTMVELETSAYLLFTASWSASQSDLNALRSELANRNQERDVNRIKLSFAAITAPRCNALIGDGSGSFQTVATSTTSAVPPYDAAFNLFLQDDRLAQAKAGLSGERGFLGIEYLAELQLPISATATFHARANDLIPWLRSQRSSSADLSELLGEAVERRLADVSIDMPDPWNSELAVELYNRVIAQAAPVLSRSIEQDERSDIRVTVTSNQNVSEPVRAFADIGAIVSTEPPQAITGGENAAN